MKLNYACMRDCLIYLENHQNVRFGDASHTIELVRIPFSQFCNDEDLQAYSVEEIFYTLMQLEKAELIYFGEVRRHQGRIDDFDVEDISDKGHNFLANIRSEKVKNVMDRLGEVTEEVSIDSIIKAASDLAYNLILLSHNDN